MPGLIENLRFDLPAGFILFLIALPLSLGIAIASGAPPIAGVITAVIGGVIGALISGSHVTINGAAAGLIAIVYGAVNGLGFDPATGDVDLIRGFRAALAVGVVCGIIQIGMGLLKLGKMTNIFPLNVVHGMLAGIGIIIMAKQVHLAVGVDFSGGMIATIAAIPASFANMVPSVALIGGISLGLMILWPRLGRIAQFVPAPLAVVIVAIGLSKALSVPDAFLVSVPTNIADAYLSPDWSQVATPLFWKFVVTYVFVASLESLLTAAAMDKMDPWKRRSDMNRELIGKGAANTLSSFVGGLPMIAEVVRSSANIMNGARTRWANFFHGVFLAVAVVAIPQLLNMIPLAALAGMLVFIGFRLAHPKEFIHAAKTGNEEVFYMAVTAVLVVVEDLLIGVIAGFVLALVINAVRGVRGVKAPTEITDAGEQVTLKLRGAHGFLNFLSLRGVLDDLPPGKALTLDLSEVRYIDHTVHEQLHDFEGEYARTGGSVRVIGKDRLKSLAESHVAALRATS
ncbi:SulP family inorganic anion transporter [Roseovarius autotrophicus]|uniref:SulP family inorganic anion transporter n=1 Tax=Roseovarius autotrophicus TaxID=2824121 RepID=UPI001B39669D